jgi:hypothetical protein
MRIDDKLLKIVAFLGLRMADGNLVHVGSGFFLVGPPPESRGCLITARHVIDGVRNTGLQSIFVGLNPSNGSAEWIETTIGDWMLPQNENLDLALLPRTFNELADHLYLPARLILSDQDVTALNVGIGDEVFACGLFSIHPGENRILPVIRVGNVSRYPAEKLHTDKFGTIEAFLIELRSLGGLSGSPVFIHLV